MNKKLFVTSILSVAALALGNCGSIPRPTLQEAKPEAQIYKLELCGVTVSIPANFRVEKDMQSLSAIHIVKDDIDIVAAPTTESDLKKLEKGSEWTNTAQCLKRENSRNILLHQKDLCSSFFPPKLLTMM